MMWNSKLVEISIHVIARTHTHGHMTRQHMQSVDSSGYSDSNPTILDLTRPGSWHEREREKTCCRNIAMHTDTSHNSIDMQSAVTVGAFKNARWTHPLPNVCKSVQIPGRTNELTFGRLAANTTGGFAFIWSTLSQSQMVWSIKLAHFTDRETLKSTYAIRGMRIHRPLYSNTTCVCVCAFQSAHTNPPCIICGTVNSCTHILASSSSG